MSMVTGVVASVVGGAVGAVAWAGVAYATEREIGWIAWGVGALAGYGMSLGLKGVCDRASGFVAALIALAAVGAGKYAVVRLSAHDAVAEYGDGPVIDYDVVSILADEVAVEWEEEGRSLEWPADMSMQEAFEAEDYPAGVWEEAEARFAAMTPGALAVKKQEIAEQRAVVLALVERQIAAAGFEASFGAYDLLWAFLAIGTAFQLGSKPKENPAASTASGAA
jgi:hypothetical protein